MGLPSLNAAVFLFVALCIAGAVCSDPAGHQQKINLMKNKVISEGGRVSDALSFELCDKEKFIGGRCVIASRDIDAGETLFELPWQGSISPKLAWDSLPETIKSIDKLEFESNAVLAFHLITEREKMRKGQESSIGEWLSLLPDYKGLPLYYHEDDLDYIPAGSKSIYNDLIGKVDLSYEKYVANSHENATILLDRNVYNKENWKWAITTVIDRHLPLSLNGTTFSILTPLVDMFNTHYNRTLTLATMENDAGIRVIATEKFQKGEQLYINAHLDSNSELFARGGYALEGNPASKLQLILPDLTDDPTSPIRQMILRRHGINISLDGKSSLPVYLRETPLLTTVVLRVLEATMDEFTMPYGNFTEPVTLRNELNTLRTLINIGSRLESANNSRVTLDEDVKAYQEETDMRRKYARLVDLETRVIGQRLVMESQMQWNRYLFETDNFVFSGSNLPSASDMKKTEESTRQTQPQSDNLQPSVPGEEALEISDGEEDSHWMEKDEF